MSSRFAPLAAGLMLCGGATGCIFPDMLVKGDLGPPETGLFRAAREGYEEEVAGYLKQGVDPNHISRECARR